VESGWTACSLCSNRIASVGGPFRSLRDRVPVGRSVPKTRSSGLTEFDAMAAELRPLIDKVHCEENGFAR
jgi:hypothetical protein